MFQINRSVSCAREKSPAESGASQNEHQIYRAAGRKAPLRLLLAVARPPVAHK